MSAAVQISTNERMREALFRAARFGANIADAHSCLIFVPPIIFSSPSKSNAAPAGRQDLRKEAQVLILAGHQSLSPDLVVDSSISSESGLIGWAARHHRSIHVSPFELNSRTLGLYREDHDLKSFIAVPISLKSSYQLLGAENIHTILSGVLVCDSKKSFAFSKLQGKLLENLALEIKSTIELILATKSSAQSGTSWRSFLEHAEEFTQTVGRDSLEVLRVRVGNLEELEKVCGTSEMLGLLDQFQRLVEQSVPPEVPSFRLPNGDLVLVVDSMMGSFYEGKVRVIAAHVRGSRMELQIDCSRARFRKKHRELQAIVSIENLITESARELASSPEAENKRYAQSGT